MRRQEVNQLDFDFKDRNYLFERGLIAFICESVQKLM